MCVCVRVCVCVRERDIVRVKRKRERARRLNLHKENKIIKIFNELQMLKTRQDVKSNQIELDERN